MSAPVPETPARSRVVLLAIRVLIALALVAAPAWTVLSTGGTVAHQHRSLAVLLGASALAGLVLLALTVRAWRRPAGAGASGRTRARRVLRATGAALGLLALAVLAGAAAWLRPFPATAVALAALVSDEAVQVHETSGWYAFVPESEDGEEPAVGLVYSPGARVDVRATAAVLRPLAEAGYLVVVLKEPLGIALTDLDQSADAIDAFDQVDRWVVGGHSLGGVAAARFAATHQDLVSGLLLHASYPLDDMSDADLLVTSVSGSEDGLTTPADIAASRADLPATTVFVEVPGAVHAFFADYGAQPGDGEPTVPRAQAQAEIVAAGLALLDRVAATTG
jgi:dienelactone hydrolase